MKFAKQLETEAEDIPQAWRPYLIQYKALKKIISKVTQEIESRGLSASLLHKCLDDENKDNKLPAIRYYFTGEPPHIKPNIELIYDPTEPKVQEILGRLTSTDDQTPKLEYKRSQNNKDFFTMHSEKEMIVQSQNMVDVVKELLNVMTIDNSDESDEICANQKRETRSFVIELEQDDEFFKLLLKELNEASKLQDETTEKFKQDISALESRMSKVASPGQKKTDMYNWRKIFSIYMDACVFQTSNTTIEKSKKQLQWFLSELDKTDQLRKLKNKESKLAFEQFMALNTELITMKHYQMLNQTAMRKILKKHDKQSGLTASSAFHQVIPTEHLFSPKLARMLYATITEKLTSVVPQPEDYACPVCMCVAWRPIRLECNHVFCVRCLVKAQKQKMNSCPMCRHPTAVRDATALNLDESLQNFLKLYFPREIKDKKRDNEREQAIEDVQAMTGKRYSEEQLLRMSQSSNCCMM